MPYSESDTVALSFKRQLATLRCEACGFSFAEYYGQEAAAFIEAHHKRPLSTGSRRTTVEDFNAVCANCHRMLHWQGLRTVEQLRVLLAKQRQSSKEGGLLPTQRPSDDYGRV